ncbi:unnamed protein product [Meloidogyne enterolobii]|uniref:Uncharacterized protein n=1 Tax=Meloidogyne enterolobii TaxID=390850 RepID=A0ACB1B3F4_MELEN
MRLKKKKALLAATQTTEENKFGDNNLTEASTQVSAECEEVEEAAEEVMEVAATTASEEFLKGLFFENF